MKKTIHILYWIILCFYLFLLVDTVFFARDSMRSVNFVPFHMISQNILVDDGVQFKWADMNVWGNILMFVPAGIYIMLHGKSLSVWRNLLHIIGLSITIEVIQFICARGATDIDDVILNAIGGFLGIIVYMVFAKVFKSRERIKMAIAVLSLIVGIPIVILTIILAIAN
ncbi:VanZ family protein [Bacillus sp. 1P06AnD]|uniref:VanZ family protein n=1 Tax=Bacillus sp. 1P06AnD TaxID=3132208 RepID=UPI0039A23D2D